MADARHARAERRAALSARVAQTAPVGGPPRRSTSPATNAATGPAGNKQQASLLHPSVRQVGRTATPSLTRVGSLSHTHRAPMEARAVLLAANELLHYRPVDDLYKEWLARFTELVSAAGGSPAPSLSLPRPPSCAGDAAQEVPPSPPPQEGALSPRHVAPGRDPPCPVPARQERSCQEIPRPQEGACVLPAPARHERAPAPAHQDPALRLEAAHQDFQDQALHRPRPPRPLQAVVLLQPLLFLL